MSELKGSKTLNNLQEAFAGESQANRRYLAFAKQADADGFPQVAKLFRAAAEAETVHAHAHLKAMEGIGSTEENLREAVGGETHEFQSMYPGMIAAAKEEGFKKAQRSFDYANQVEQIHAGLYQKALDNLDFLVVQDIFLTETAQHADDKDRISSTSLTLISSILALVRMRSALRSTA